MSQYYIHQAEGEGKFTETVNQPRKYVGFVEADSLEEAFQKSQNGDQSNWNNIFPCRPTSVGDIIQGPYDFYMVTNSGFLKL